MWTYTVVEGGVWLRLIGPLSNSKLTRTVTLAKIFFYFVKTEKLNLAKVGIDHIVQLKLQFSYHIICLYRISKIVKRIQFLFMQLALWFIHNYILYLYRIPSIEYIQIKTEKRGCRLQTIWSIWIKVSTWFDEVKDA